MKGEWKIFLESILLESRAGNYRTAVRLADEALLLHAGTGRLWAILVQLCHRLEGLVWMGKRVSRSRGSRERNKGRLKLRGRGAIGERVKVDDELVAHCVSRESKEVVDVKKSRGRGRDRCRDKSGMIKGKALLGMSSSSSSSGTDCHFALRGCEDESRLHSEEDKIQGESSSTVLGLKDESEEEPASCSDYDEYESESESEGEGDEDYPVPSKHAVLVRAIQEVPKSGEVWCEGARCHMNPLHVSSFDLTNAQKFLSFAVQFTPQYGDTFVEYLRLEMIIQVILPRALHILGIPIVPFFKKNLQYDVESDCFNMINNYSWLQSIAQSGDENADVDFQKSNVMKMSGNENRRKRIENIDRIEKMDFDIGHCVEAYKNIELKNLCRR